MRHEDLIENTTTFLLDFQEQFHLRTKPGFPYEVGSLARSMLSSSCQRLGGQCIHASLHLPIRV